MIVCGVQMKMDVSENRYDFWSKANVKYTKICLTAHNAKFFFSFFDDGVHILYNDCLWRVFSKCETI